jgi:hypothetical protein
LNLSKEEQRTYIKKNPTPFFWLGFYKITFYFHKKYGNLPNLNPNEEKKDST